MRTPFNIAPVTVKFTDISTAIGTWSELLGHAFRCSDVRKSPPPDYHRLAPNRILLLSAFRFEDITHRAARNRFAFHGITSEDDFGF